MQNLHYDGILLSISLRCELILLGLMIVGSYGRRDTVESADFLVVRLWLQEVLDEF